MRDSLRLGALSFDAVKHLVLCRLERRPPRLDLELYLYLCLPRVRVRSAAGASARPTSPWVWDWPSASGECRWVTTRTCGPLLLT